MSLIDQLSQKKIEADRINIARKMQKIGMSLEAIKVCTGLDLTKL